MGLMTYQQGHNRDITHTDRIPSPWSPVAHPLSFLASRTTSGVYAKPLPTQRSSGCTINGLGKMTPQFILILTRRTSPVHAQPQRYKHTSGVFCQPQRYKHTSGISHRKRHPSRQIMSFFYFLKIPFYLFKTLVPLFLVKRL
jgi:hypothetical protein